MRAAGVTRHEVLHKVLLAVNTVLNGIKQLREFFVGIPVGFIHEAQDLGRDMLGRDFESAADMIVTKLAKVFSSDTTKP